MRPCQPRACLHRNKGAEPGQHALGQAHTAAGCELPGCMRCCAALGHASCTGSAERYADCSMHKVDDERSDRCSTVPRTGRQRSGVERT